MKVLLVCGLYTDGQVNMASQFVHHQAVELKNMGIDVAVISLDMRSIRRKRKFGINHYVIDGIPVWVASFPCGPINGVLEKLSSLYADMAYKRVVKTWGIPDLIHGHFHHNTNAIANIAQKHNIPLVTTEHGTKILPPNRTVGTEKKARIAYKNSNAVISVSKVLKASIEEFSNSKITIIPNILSSNFKLTPVTKNDYFTFLAVGHLIKRKNMDIIIKSFAEFTNKISDARLQIIGKGEMKNELLSLSEELNVIEKIDFMGRVENKNLVDIYNKDHCFVLPSACETFGVVYIEAMACGLPVIATKSAEINGIVDASNGIALNSNSVEDVYNAMKYIYENYEDYNRQIISQNCLSKYGSSSVASRIIEVYDEVIKDANRTQ